MIKSSIETIKELERELKGTKKLYDFTCIKWTGKTFNTGEYYAEVIAKELLKPEKLALLEKIEQINRSNYSVKSHNGQHNVDTNRAEEIFAKDLKGKKLEKLGLVVDFQVPLKEKRSDDAGKIDLVTSTNKSVYIIELKYTGNPETLLRAILEIWTYYKQLNKANFLGSFEALKQNKTEDIKKALLLKAGCNAYDEAKDLTNRPALKRLVKSLEVSIFLQEKNETIVELE